MNIKLHSFTDLITNSSTTIYTNSINSEKACKDMVAEFLKAFGIKEKPNKIFNIYILFSNDSVYLEYPDNDSTEMKQMENGLFEKVRSGECKKPKWFYEAEKRGWGNSALYINALDPKYENLAQSIVDFLSSRFSEEQQS